MNVHQLSAILIAMAAILAGCDPEPTPSNGPQSLSLTIDVSQLTLPKPTEANRLVANEFFQAISSAHASCGLKAVEFQESIGQLQRVSAGTEFQELSSAFVTAARLCHDSKVKPTKYASRQIEERSLDQNLKTAPKLSVTTTGPAIVLTCDVERSQTTWEKTDVVEAVEYAPEIVMSPVSLKGIQEIEDSVYAAILAALRRQGFHRFKKSDLDDTKWSWKWQSEGHIEFLLHANGTMEALLYPATNDIVYKLSDWGGGDWSLEGDRLVITMRRVGKRGVPLLTKEHEVTWIDRRIDQLSKDTILLESGEKLHLLKTK